MAKSVASTVPDLSRSARSCSGLGSLFQAASKALRLVPSFALISPGFRVESRPSIMAIVAGTIGVVQEVDAGQTPYFEIGVPLTSTTSTVVGIPSPIALMVPATFDDSKRSVPSALSAMTTMTLSAALFGSPSAAQLNGLVHFAGCVQVLIFGGQSLPAAATMTELG